MEDKQLKEITQRLDKLARIIALTNTQDLTMTERIHLLNNVGFSPTEIANILGTSANVVNVRLSEMRKKKRENKGNAEED
jgi:DNA-directed RNA polymerase specialized sigma24 family protein